MNARDAIAANIRAERARTNISQDELASRMKAMGFTVWRRQTTAEVEHGKRRVTAEEVLGLAVVLGTTADVLMTVR